MSTVPIIIEKTSSGERAYDLYSRLMKDRIIMLTGGVDDHVASIVVGQLLLMNERPDEDVKLYINSPGGLVTAGMAIYDTMQFVECDVSTIVVGEACSMGAMLAMAGEPGKRFILPYSRVMIHQPSGGYVGTTTDTKIHVDEMSRWKEVLTDLAAKHTGQDRAKVAADMERDKFMDAKQAVEYGVVDAII